MNTSGELQGAKFEIKNGSLTFRLQKHQSDEVVEFLQKLIKQWARAEPSPKMFLSIIRASYMAYQLQKDCKLLELDQSDIELLYEMESSGKTQWFFQVVNYWRSQIRWRDYRIEMAMTMAKDMNNIFTE